MNQIQFRDKANQILNIFEFLTNDLVNADQPCSQFKQNFGLAILVFDVQFVQLANGK